MIKGLSSNGREKIEESVELFFDKMIYKLLGYNPNNKRIEFFVKRPDESILDLFIQSLGMPPNEIEQNAAKKLLKSSYGYLSSLREKTKTKIADAVDSAVSESSGSINTSTISSIINDELSKAKSHFNTIAVSETTRAKNLGHAMLITRSAAAEGDEDPNCYFVVKQDIHTCKYCINNHLHPDGRPKVFKLSELKQGYLSKEERSAGECSLHGQHPNCFTENQRLFTFEGLFTFKELFETQKRVLATVDNRVTMKKFPANQFGIEIPGTVRFNRHAEGSRFLLTTPVYDTGIQECVEIELSSGHKIEVSLGHEMWVDNNKNGKKIKAKNIKVGDKIPIISGNSGFGNDSFPDIAELIGNLLGDGVLTKDTAKWYGFGNDIDYIKTLYKKAKNISKAHQFLEELKVIPPDNKYSVERVSFNSQVLRNIFVEEFGVSKKPIRVPSRIFKADRITVASFLRGLYAADGHSEKNSVVLSQNDKEFLQEIQMLLSAFGIKSRIFKHDGPSEKVIKYRDGREFLTKRKPCWKLIIGASKEARYFVTEIGFGVQAKQSLALKNTENSLNSSFGWRTARVISIKSIGLKQTYCLTEPTVNTITVNGIVTGQCRCRLVYIGKHFGFDKNNKITFINFGHNEYSYQQELYSKTGKNK